MSTPKLRFKEFSGDWEIKKLGEIFKITSGTTPLRANTSYFKNGNNNWVKTTDLNNGLIFKTSESITDLAIKETSIKILPINTVLVAMYGGFNQIGRTGLLTMPSAVNQALSAILPNNELINPYYLLTFLNYKVDDWKNFAASSRKDPNITKKDVECFKINYPSLPEQTKIANFLTAVDDKITLLTKKADLLSQYKKGVMQQIFSQELRFKDDDGQEFPEWEERILDNVTLSISNGLSLDQSLENIGFMVTRIETISDKKINLEKVGYVQTEQDISSYKLDMGDILFSNINSISHIGKVVCIEKDYQLYHGMNLLRIVINQSTNHPKFIFYQLDSKKMKQHFERKANKAVNQASINQTELKKTKLKIPSKVEQTKIANFLTAIDEKITNNQTQLDAVKQYKQGLLQQMFV